MKKIILFLLFLFPWFFSTFFIHDYSFYQEIHLPSFAPPANVFAIIWPIIYIGIAMTLWLLQKEYGLQNIKEYTYIILKPPEQLHD